MIGKRWWERGNSSHRPGAYASSMAIIMVLTLFVLAFGTNWQSAWADDGTDASPVVVQNEAAANEKAPMTTKLGDLPQEAATQEPLQSDPESAERLPVPKPDPEEHDDQVSLDPLRIPTSASCTESGMCVWTTIHNQEMLDHWAEIEFMPSLEEVDEVPMEEAVLDMDIIAPDADGACQHMKMRIRGSDGAVAVVFVQRCGIDDFTDGDIWFGEQDVRGWSPCPGAGPYWPVCCWVQGQCCNFWQRLLWWFPSSIFNCNGCAGECWGCNKSHPVNDPCHTCDPWGMSLFLCKFIPFGHC